MSKTSPTKFLIVGNGRTGSTWLETMLGCLPEVAVDYELKWNPIGYELPPHLRVIPNRPSGCGDLLLEIGGDHSIVGSKLILDKRLHSPSEYADLHATIDRDIRIIHLVRDYYDVVLSWYRGVYHVLNENATSEESDKSSEIYKSISGEKSSTEPRFVEKLAYLVNYPRDYLRTGDPLPILQFLNRHGLGNFDTTDREMAKFKTDLEYCLANDMWAHSLCHSHPHYCSVRYSEIPQDFTSMTRFIGSNASESSIQEILDNPISKKLPPKDARLLCSSPERLKELCTEFNRRRDSLARN